MEDKLKNLRSVLDETLFQDGEFSEKGKANVHRRIEKHRQASSFNIFRRLGPWFKPVLSTVVCLFLFLGAVYLVNHQGGEGSSSSASYSALKLAGAFPYPQFLSKQEGKLNFLYIGKSSHEKAPISFDLMNGLAKKTISKKQHMSLREAKKNLSKLHIQQTPYYLFFDKNGVAFRSANLKKTGRFLHEYLVKKTGFPYPQLLSAKKGKLRALIIDDIPGGFKSPTFLKTNQASHLLAGYTGVSLKDAQKYYPKLDIPDQNPYFIFFNADGVVYRTDSEQDAAHFVKERLKNDPVPFPYPKLLSHDNGRFYLLKIGEPKDFYLSKPDMAMMIAGMTGLNLKQAQQLYPKLKINKSPYYILFDQKGVAFRGDSVKKMKQFLNQQFPYPILLSDQKGKYALLVVQKNHGAHYPDFLKNVDLTNKNLARLGLSNVHFPALQQAKQDFPKLHVKSAPAFLFFDTKGLAFQTNSEQKAVQFLEKK